MSRRDRLSGFAEQVGFSVTVGENEVVAENVPCLLKGGTVSSCTIRQSFDPATGKPDGRIGTATPCGSDHYRPRVRRAGVPRRRQPDWNPSGMAMEEPGRRSLSAGAARTIQKTTSHHRHGTPLCEAYRGGMGGSRPHRNGFSCEAESVQDTEHLRGTSSDRPDSGSDPRSANCDHRPRRYGCLRPGPLGEDTRAANPPFGFRHFGWHTFMRAPGAPTDHEIKCKRRRLGTKWCITLRNTTRSERACVPTPSAWRAPLG